MESSSGYIPVSKVPLLETQLMELPERIRELELILQKARTQHDENEEKLERMVKRAADALRNLDVGGLVYRDTDEFNEKVIKTLECDEEYIALNKLYEDTETTLDEGEIQIQYLCKFRACIAVSRLI